MDGLGKATGECSGAHRKRNLVDHLTSTLGDDGCPDHLAAGQMPGDALRTGDQLDEAILSL